MRQSVYRGLGADPLARLRRLRGQSTTQPDEDDLRAAMQRVFKGPDGRKLLDYMILHSYGMTIPAAAPDSALREKEARQKFLDQILALAAEDPRVVSQPPTQPPDPSLPG